MNFLLCLKINKIINVHSKFAKQGKWIELIFNYIEITFHFKIFNLIKFFLLKCKILNSDVIFPQFMVLNTLKINFFCKQLSAPIHCKYYHNF